MLYPAPARSPHPCAYCLRGLGNRYASGPDSRHMARRASNRNNYRGRAVIWYYATWDETGDSQRFSSIDAIVRYIMDYGLEILNATFICVKPDGQWRDCGLLIDAALEEERLAAGYDAEHVLWASSAQRTGR